MVRLSALVDPARLKRWSIGLAAAAVIVLGGLAMRATIAVDEARGEIEASLSALTGRPIRVAGSGVVRLLPWPSVRFYDVTVSDADRTVARMDELIASLDVAALLLGRLRAAELHLARPDIHFAIDPSIPTPVALAAWLRGWTPTSVTIEKGRVTLATPTGEEILDGVDARLGWPRPSANIDLAAGLRWRGETVSFEAEFPSPTAMVDGGAGTVSLRLGSGPLRLAFSGTGGPFAATRFEGSGDVDLVDAGRFARWTGRPRTPDLLAGRLRLDGRLTVDRDGATMPAARLELAGNKGEGALTLRWSGERPRLGGTLAFADLDLTGERRRPLGTGWRALPLDEGTHGLDLDLRLSVPAVRLPGAALTRVAAALHVADRRLHAEIGNAEYLGKPLALVIRGTFERDGLRAQIRGNADDLPLAELASLAEMPGIEAGRLSAAIEAETRCRLVGDCAAGLGGRVGLDARALTVTGASPFADISRFRPIVPQANGTRVTTNWERVGVALRLSGLRTEVDRVEILGQGVRFLFEGSGDLSTGGVDLTGHAYFPAFRPDPARNGTNEVAVPMRIGGTLRRLEAMARDLPPQPNGAPAPTVSP